VTVDGKTVTFSSDDDVLEDVGFCLKGGPHRTGPLSGLSRDTDGIANRRHRRVRDLRGDDQCGAGVVR
jgi:hypothetical protein